MARAKSFWDSALGQVTLAAVLVVWAAALIALLWVVVVLIHVLFNLPMDIR